MEPSCDWARRFDVPKTLGSGYSERNMAALQIAPARQSSNAPALILSLLLLASVAGAIFYFNPHKIAEFKVTSVDTFAPHSTFGALEGTAATANGMHVLDEPSTSSEDDLYVVAHLQLTNKLRLPIFISGAVAHATLADGTQMESNLLSDADMKRLEVIFPAIHKYAPDVLSDGDEIAPGQTRTAAVVLPFPGQTAAAWHNKQSATLTIDLRNQHAQITGLP